MFSLFERRYDNEQFLIMRFVILFCRNQFSRSEHYWASMIVVVSLIQNVNYDEIWRICLHFNFFFEIKMNKKRNEWKYISKLLKSLLRFFALIIKIWLFVFFIVFQQISKRCCDNEITIYETFIKIDKAQENLHFFINFWFKSFFNRSHSLWIHLYFINEYNEFQKLDFFNVKLTLL